MVAYPAKLDFDVSGMVMLTMPDVPELVVVARRECDALSRAPAILDSILSGYSCEDRPMPAPSRITGAPMVTPRRFCLADAD
jgi:hypothetical protein